MGPMVEGCSISGGIDGFVAVLRTAILTGWLDSSGGGFSPVLEYCWGGFQIPENRPDHHHNYIVVFD
jgi:hypothetical protein